MVESGSPQAPGSWSGRLALTGALALAGLALAFADPIHAWWEYRRLRADLASDIRQCHRGATEARRREALSEIAAQAGVPIPPQGFVYSRGPEPDGRLELRASYTRRVLYPTGPREERFELHFFIGLPAVEGAT